MTEKEWIKFGKLIPVGTRVQWRYIGLSSDGTLLENYPHTEKAEPPHPSWATTGKLQVQFDDDDTPCAIFARYEYYWFQGEWTSFDDIMMFEEEIA